MSVEQQPEAWSSVEASHQGAGVASALGVALSSLRPGVWLSPRQLPLQNLLDRSGVCSAQSRFSDQPN